MSNYGKPAVEQIKYIAHENGNSFLIELSDEKYNGVNSYYDLLSDKIDVFPRELQNHIFKITLSSENSETTEYIFYRLVDEKYIVYKINNEGDTGNGYLNYMVIPEDGNENFKEKYVSISFIYSEIDYAKNLSTNGGSKKSSKLPKKEILGKLRCVYKVPGSRKEHIKYKGQLITVSDYKKLMKSMAKPKAKPKPKPKAKANKPKKQ
jgi:hypothetical protein